MIKRKLLSFLKKTGYSVTKTNNIGIDIKEKEFWDIYNICKAYTMTSIERMYALYCSTKYILSNNIKGDFVECGVWRGGSSMLIAKMLANRNITNKKIFMYDTFDGMSEPTDHDSDFKHKKAFQQLKKSSKKDQLSVWCYASFEEVKENMAKVTSADNIFMVKGKVEETLPNEQHKDGIALLRLDTDWYESTHHELIHLYPNLTTNGVIIIDDYGHWEGARKAVDDYFKKEGINILLNRIDYTGRIGVNTKN